MSQRNFIDNIGIRYKVTLIHFMRILEFESKNLKKSVRMFIRQSKFRRTINKYKVIKSN